MMIVAGAVPCAIDLLFALSEAALSGSEGIPGNPVTLGAGASFSNALLAALEPLGLPVAPTDVPSVTDSSEDDQVAAPPALLATLSMFAALPVMPTDTPPSTSPALEFNVLTKAPANLAMDAMAIPIPMPASSPADVPPRPNPEFALTLTNTGPVAVTKTPEHVIAKPELPELKPKAHEPQREPFHSVPPHTLTAARQPAIAEARLPIEDFNPATPLHAANAESRAIAQPPISKVAPQPSMQREGPRRVEGRAAPALIESRVTEPESPRTSDPPAPVEEARLMPTLEDRFPDLMQQVRERGHVEVRMELHPPELGRMHLHLALEDGEVSVRMFVENDGAKQVLDTQMEPLRVRFEEMGVSLGQFDVRRDGNSGEQHPPQEFEMASDQPRSGRSMGPRGPYANVAAPRGLVDVLA